VRRYQVPVILQLIPWQWNAGWESRTANEHRRLWSRGLSEHRRPYRRRSALRVQRGSSSPTKVRLAVARSPFRAGISRTWGNAEADGRKAPATPCWMTRPPGYRSLNF